MKLTKKQISILINLNQNPDWKILINHGAKRSGKTFLDNLLFIKELARAKRNAEAVGVDNPQYILAGYTLSNIQRNVILELMNVMGIDLHFDKYNGFDLLGVHVVQTSTGSISGIGRIRGMTSFGAYINEATLCNKEVFNEILSRCSGKGARIICDTNPDNPEHWLLKDYIEKAGHDGIVANHFTFEDNEMLDEGYKQNRMATTPKGMFYDRDIKGLWVSGAGVVYPEFNRETMSISQENAFAQSYDRYMVGVDWGFHHPTVFAVCGVSGERVTLLEEHAASERQIPYWVEIAKDIRSRYGNIPFYCDTANPEHIGTLNDNGLNAINGNKNVMNGIEYVAGKIHNDNFRVVYEACPEFVKEIYHYVWNDNTGQVVKEYDHCLDALRYAIYTDHLMRENTGMNLEDLGRLRGFI